MTIAEWLAKAWALVLLPDPNVLGGIIGAVFGGIAGIVGALIGAHWGGKLAMRAAQETAEQAANAEATRTAAERLASTAAFVNALRAEISALVEQANAGIVPAIRTANMDTGMEVVFPISLNYFVVYPANAARLGDIENEPLRTSM